MKLQLRIDKEDINTYNIGIGLTIRTQLFDVFITTEALDELYLDYSLKRTEEEADKKK